MAEPRRADADVLLQVKGLNVYYGRSHALQGVDLTLDHGVLSVVGRNGMGKTTLCKTIMGLVRASSGSIRMRGEELLGLPPAQDRAPRRRLRAAGAAALALAHRRRAPAHDRGAAAAAPGRSSASTTPSRAWPNGEATAARSSPAASSRCWRSPARW